MPQKINLKGCKIICIFDTFLALFILFLTSLEVRIPRRRAILLRRLYNIFGVGDAPSDDDDVGAALDHRLLGGDVLLAEGVPARGEIHAGRELDDVGAVGQPRLADVSEEERSVAKIHAFRGVVGGDQVACD